MLLPTFRWEGDKDVRTLICGAIRQRHLLQFTYDGERRVVEPYCYGTSSRKNNVLRAYQVAGGSKSSGETVGWKLFDSAKIESLEVLATQFTPLRPDYNPNDRNMVTIDCRA